MEKSIKAFIKKKGGCGSKIPSDVLEDLLSTLNFQEKEKNIIEKEDCAVYEKNSKELLLVNVDFFSPPMEDPYLFGKISATNAWSDIYAKGGKPLFAMNILTYPTSKIKKEIIQKILEGGKEVTEKAKAIILGGHTTESDSLQYGLVAVGEVEKRKFLSNSNIKKDEVLFYTKKIGTGILFASNYNEPLPENVMKPLLSQVLQSNVIGKDISELSFVSSATDVTGFGLIGHAMEMIGEKETLKIVFNSDNLKKIHPMVETIVEQKKIYSDMMMQNMRSFSLQVAKTTWEKTALYYDPQTSGGILFSVPKEKEKETINFLKKTGLEQIALPIGNILKREKEEKKIYIH